MVQSVICVMILGKNHSFSCVRGVLGFHWAVHSNNSTGKQSCLSLISMWAWVYL